MDKNPKSLQAHLGLIDLALINKQPQEAFKQYQLAEKYVGSHQDLDFSLVKIYLAMNDRHSAHIHAKKLTESAPNIAKSWRLLAVTLDTNGNHEEAHQVYEKALELEPNNIKTKSNYGLSLAMGHQAEKAVVSYGGVQMGLLEKNISWLSLFIALAPMLGFMGTVIGMIGAFDSIQAANDISPGVVAGGIKVALLTTVFGLIVAIILQIFYNYIISKVDSIVNNMEDASISLVDLLIRHKK